MSKKYRYYLLKSKIWKIFQEKMVIYGLQHKQMAFHYSETRNSVTNYVLDFITAKVLSSKWVIDIHIN